MPKKVVCTIPPRIFLVEKPAGIHSGDVLKHFKYHLPVGFGKIGHLGTLDPFAEGLLLVAVGQAARLNFLFTEGMTKTYEARGIFHFKSSTGDCAGELSEIRQSNVPSIEVIQKKMDSMIGQYWQAPPYYSASKHEGRPLYEYARKGIFIDKPKVARSILEFKALELFGEEEVTFISKVSSGTYIRTLFEDLCGEMNLVGYLKSLKRLEVGSISLENALNRDRWPTRGESFDTLKESFCPSEFFDFPKCFLDSVLEKRVLNGQRIPLVDIEQMPKLTNTNYMWYVGEGDVLRGLAEVVEGIVRPIIIFPKI